VLRYSIVESRNDVRLSEIRLDSRVGWDDFEVEQHAINERKRPVNEAVVPLFRLTHFDGYSRDFGAHKSRFNATWFARVDFQSIGLEELGEAFDVGKAEVGVAPE
jgi:hypothetical protein